MNHVHGLLDVIRLTVIHYQTHLMIRKSNLIDHCKIRVCHLWLKPVACSLLLIHAFIDFHI